jgi:ornithine cyclodeaminase
MVKIYTLDRIKSALKNIDIVKAVEEGFIDYSRGKVVVPPVGEMTFDNPPGEVHIKYGYIKNDDYYVIKIASGFYENHKLGLPTGSGLMLVFNQKTGELLSVLMDECALTEIRTAAAGAVSAKYLAPGSVHRIGIVGAGMQGRLQLEYLKFVVECRDVIVWGIDQKEVDLYKTDMEPMGFNIETTLNTDDVISSCNLIVTATPSKKPLLKADKLQKGTHITAMGSDTLVKQELDPKILQRADIIVADSISQCLLRGEIFKAISAGVISKEDVVELGNVIVDKKLQRLSDDQITIADLTGVAVQDIQISKAVYEALNK